MIGRTNAGGGGLSLTVKTHASAPASTQSGRENEIWVVSNTPSQYWAVKATEPVASDWGESVIPNGALWIANDRNINELDVSKDKKNYLGVNPSSCAQRVQGAWSNVEAYLFHNGKWVQFSIPRIDIYKAGVFSHSVQHVTYEGGAIVYGTNYIDMRNGDSIRSYATIRVGPMDLNSLSTVIMKYYDYSGGQLSTIFSELYIENKNLEVVARASVPTYAPSATTERTLQLSIPPEIDLHNVYVRFGRVARHPDGSLGYRTMRVKEVRAV